MATVNLATKYSNKVDEKFEHQSQASLVTNNSYDFTGAKTVKIYSLNTVQMNDYDRGNTATGDTGYGAANWSRYGKIENVSDSLQTLTVTKDRSWTFSIDKGDRIQSEMVREAGKHCARQIAQVVIPEYDKFVFSKIAYEACQYTDGNGAAHFDATSITKNNAYEEFLKAQEILGNALAPDAGRVCLCSYGFANKLKMDSAFMRYGDMTQDMILKGVLGEADGTKIVKVPSSRLPAGCDFILAHPMATVAPKQLWEYKIHTDVPGLSGWLCEGRVIYDAFVLENKKDAIFYHGTAVTQAP